MEVRQHLGRIRQLEMAIREEKFAIGRGMRPEEKFLAGPWLFDRACRRLESEIRGRYPHAEQQEVREVVTQVLGMARRLEEIGCQVQLPGETLDEEALTELQKRA